MTERPADFAVGIVGYLPSSSGAAAHTYELATALGQAGLDVSLLTFGVEGEERQALERLGVEVVEAGFNPSRFEFAGGPAVAYLRASQGVRAFVKSRRVNTVFHFTLAPATVALEPLPAVVSAWDPLTLAEGVRRRVLPLRFPLPLLGLLGLAHYNALDRRAYRFGNVVLCSTEQVLRRVQQLVGGKAWYCPPLISVPAHDQFPIAHVSAKVNLLFLSKRITNPRKGFYVLVKGLSSLDGRVLRSVRLRLRGNGSEEAAGFLRRLMPELEVQSIGRLPRENLMTLLEDTNLYLAPSLFDDFSYGLLEAGSRGTAVLCSDLPAFREITGGEESAYLSPPGNHRALAESIRQAVTDENDRVTRAMRLRDRIREKYGAEVVRDKLLRAYSEALSNARG